MTIRKFNETDFDTVIEIYRLGIETKNATFETSPPDLKGWYEKFIREFSIVAEVSSKVVGWATLSRVSQRKVYKGVCEVTVYMHPEYSGKGIGTALLDKLIKLSEEKNVWTLQAGIFPENEASIHLHKKCGFREVGIREKIGQMDGVWRDTVLLERRSKTVVLFTK